jgi:mono/diheme cytochrome c family protein
MKRNILLIIVTVLLFFAFSCTGRQSPKKQNNMPTEVQSGIKTNTAAPAVTDLPGKKVFEKNCLTCHQADGSGVPGMYPPLNQADMVLGPADDLIRVVLFGLKGPVEVKGETYTQEMPAVDYLDDAEIADLLNYIKKVWGNEGQVITSEDVRKIRAEGKK